MDVQFQPKVVQAAAAAARTLRRSDRAARRQGAADLRRTWLGAGR